MLRLVVALYLLGTVTSVPLGGYKDSTKSFTLRPANDETRSKPRAMSRNGFAERMDKNQKSRSLLPNEFPEVLTYVMNLEGKGDVELYLVRDRSVRVPTSYAPGKSGKYESHKLNTENIAFYKDMNGHGSFACELVRTASGQSECSITAMIDIGDENCYMLPGASTIECSSKDDGPHAFVTHPKIDPAVPPVFKNNTRQKRNILPLPGFRSVEVAYLPDAKFTDLFYRRHPGDTAAAEAEMDLFFILLTNEINVFYSTIPETSSYNLKVQLFTSAVAYPGYQMNFPWSEYNNDGTNLYYSTGLENNLEYIVNDSGFITAQYDFVFAITGFNLRDATYGNPLVSYTYQSVMCTNSRKKFSLTEFTGYNLPRILSHELGHALGARHDDDTSCGVGHNLMSLNMFNPNSVTKDTFYKFSVCSAEDMIEHVYTQYPDCLTDDDFTYEEFVAQFCTGFAGSQTDYLNQQCERLTNVIGSTVCDSVNETACYARNTLRCTDSTGQCSSRKLQYVWNGTPCGTDKICYQGSCVDTFDVCTTTSTSTTSTTTTTTSTTTTSTTTTTPTTTTTTPTTTTSTTTTTTPTTTTPTTTTTSTTTTPTTTTSTTTTTPTTTTAEPLSCSCCAFSDGRRRRCCKRGLRFDGIDCYCCGSNLGVNPPPGWTGNEY